MMGSPMVLIFILPLVAIAYLFSVVSSLFGIDMEALFDSFIAWYESPAVSEFLDLYESFMSQVELFLYQNFGS